MRAAVFHGPGNIRIETVDDPELELDTDAIVRVTDAAVCGSDLWDYRGYSGTIGTRTGHEFVGIVQQIGVDVRTLRVGDVVLAPPGWSDGTCEYCRAGLSSSCIDGGVWGEPGHDGAHGELMRVPQADGTLLVVPVELRKSPEAVLGLTCAFPTAQHAAISAGVAWGTTAVIIGDGAVGLAAIQTARRLGAAQVVVVGHHRERLELARETGADATVNADADPAEAVEKIMGITGGAHCVLECVGSQTSWSIAVAVARDGGRIGHVGTPHPVEWVELSRLYDRNITLAGGRAPSRSYLPELMRAAADGELNTSAAVDLVLPLGEIVDAYAALDERVATKVHLTI
ncbi:MAG: dehydrogenase [Pseudonocardiales bacterium]|nr:dehydrogenase [Pseudonocardiales bacterium]